MVPADWEIRSSGWIDYETTNAIVAKRPAGDWRGVVWDKRKPMTAQDVADALSDVMTPRAVELREYAFLWHNTPRGVVRSVQHCGDTLAITAQTSDRLEQVFHMPLPATPCTRIRAFKDVRQWWRENETYFDED